MGAAGGTGVEAQRRGRRGSGRLADDGRRAEGAGRAAPEAAGRPGTWWRRFGPRGPDLGRAGPWRRAVGTAAEATGGVLSLARGGGAKCPAARGHARRRGGEFYGFGTRILDEEDKYIGRGS